MALSIYRSQDCIKVPSRAGEGPSSIAATSCCHTSCKMSSASAPLPTRARMKRIIRCPAWVTIWPTSLLRPSLMNSAGCAIASIQIVETDQGQKYCKLPQDALAMAYRSMRVNDIRAGHTAGLVENGIYGTQF